MKKLLLVFSIIILGSIFIFPQDYVGPEKCLTCHPSKTDWRTSMHANGYSVVEDDAHTMEDLYGIICDYDQNGIDDFKDGLNFNNINSVFDPDKPNAPILDYDAVDGYTITIGQVAHRVYLTYGGSGHYKQRYMVRINTSEGESADFYASPIQYNEKTFEYVLYHHEAWYDENNNNEPIFTPTSTLADASTNSRSFTKGCAGCHVTNLEVVQDGNGEWISSGAPVEDEALYATYNNIYDIDQNGDLDQLNTGCETCHGPGGDHVAGPTAANIINPADPDDLTTDQANNLCGMCHSRGKSLPNNTFSFPFDDAGLVTWDIGDMVATWYTDGGGYYGDAFSSSKHHQQFFDFYKSSKPGHPVTCYECHDVHNDVKHHMREEIEEEDSLGNPITIATENDNNTLCLACHATHGAFENISKEMVADYQNNITEIGNIVSLHTNHDYDPDGSGESRCSKCHQPKSIKSAIPYDIHSHTFEVLQPEKTTTFEMPNACAVSCHRGIENGGSPLFNTGVDLDLGDWSEQTDIDLADTLMHWFGPAGVWWTHVVSVEMSDPSIPENYLLSQNYPNPFNPSTQIEFSVPVESIVNIVVYDIVGREVATLVNENMPAGNYSLTWNAAGLTSGVYFYRMESQNYLEVKKMIMMK